MENKSSTISKPEVEASKQTCRIHTPISQQNCPSGQKVLGVPWNVAHDELMFSLEGIVKRATYMYLIPTERNIISLIRQIYDPLRFLGPMKIRFNTLMQNLCRVKLGWDQPLEGELLESWNGLISDLKPSLPMILPRCSHALSTV